MTTQTIKTTAMTSLIKHVSQVKSNLQAACANALKAGCLIDDLVEQGYSKSDLADQCGVSRMTINRWHNAYHTACLRLNIPIMPFDDEGIDDHFAALDELAESTTLNRLLLGSPSEKGDMARLETLQTRSETATDDDIEIYSNAIEKVENGEWTLIQAMRAVSGQSAQEKANTNKAMAQMLLTLDGTTGEIGGQLPKVITTLTKGFADWDTFDTDARLKFKAMWKDVVNQLPEDLKKF